MRFGRVFDDGHAMRIAISVNASMSAGCP